MYIYMPGQADSRFNVHDYTHNTILGIIEKEVEMVVCVIELKGRGMYVCSFEMHD